MMSEQKDLIRKLTLLSHSHCCEGVRIANESVRDVLSDALVYIDYLESELQRLKEK